MSKLHSRVGAATSNFERLLPDGESELMQQATKDPYNLEFLSTASEAHERNVEQALVIELKHRKLAPSDVGQLNFYVAVIDDTMRRRHHAPTVGLLLCSDRNERTVRYALNASTSPMAVAGYRYKELPVAEQAALPDEEHCSTSSQERCPNGRRKAGNREPATTPVVQMQNRFLPCVLARFSSADRSGELDVADHRRGCPE